MIIGEFNLKDFRNITSLSAKPCEGVNIIYGQNAQGKTNILEALWLLTGYKSFRGAKDAELIRFGQNGASVKAHILEKDRDSEVEIRVADRRRALKNGVELSAPSELLGSFYAAAFFPDGLALIKEGPGERRRFLDVAVCQLSPGYADSLRKYKLALLQRNSVLKDVPYHSELLDTLDAWEEQLAAYGARIIYKRLAYIRRLSEAAEAVYGGICDKAESFSLAYVSNGLPSDEDGEDGIKHFLLQRLKEARRGDIFQKATSIGPHRDDLLVTLSGHSARIFGSQGQQRSASLALKLAEAQVISEIVGEKPVVLLDDVMSELDLKRQDYVLNKIREYQVFITCCEPSLALRLCEGKTFHIDQGGVV